MFARTVTINLKPNTLNDFTQTLENDVVPMLHKQPGFRDEIALVGDNNTNVTAISLWDTKEQADAYATTGYPAVLKAFEKFLDGTPKVQLSKVLNSTTHKLTAAAVIAA
jgi:heme-degrading monooxygenase HmoA